MRIQLLMLFSLFLVIFLAGCVKKVEPTKIQYKNDVITVENYVVSSLSPYSKEDVAIEFDVQNNGDQPAYDIKVNFFDIPGFTVELKSDIDKGSIKCGVIDPATDKKTDDMKGCEFNKLEPLDTRKITLTTKAPDIQYPSSYTVSFSVSYLYYGVRSATIPIVDGVIKKEPSFKFSQSDPTIGPVVFDIVPMLEREKVVDKKTVKEYWGISDRIFLTKFVMKHIGKVQGKIKPVNAYVLLGGLTNLEDLAEKRLDKSPTVIKEKVKPCDFIVYPMLYYDGPQVKAFLDRLTELSEEFRNIRINLVDIYTFSYPRPVNETHNTLICNFIPSGTSYEFPATMKIVYFYNYEFIRSETFVVQPRIGFK